MKLLIFFFYNVGQKNKISPYYTHSVSVLCRSSSSRLLEQHTGLLVFKRIGRRSDADEQRVTAPVVLAVLDQVCSCQGDLVEQRCRKLFK